MKERSLSERHHQTNQLMSSGEHSYNNYLEKIQCVDGYLEYDSENNVWNEVKNG